MTKAGWVAAAGRVKKYRNKVATAGDDHIGHGVALEVTDRTVLNPVLDDREG